MIFYMSNYVVTSVKIFLEGFWRTGLAVVAGDNIALVVHWVLSVIV